jgi:hypothetical protein
MDKTTERKYNAFVANPLGYFNDAIQVLKESQEESQKSFAQVMIVIEQYLVESYVQALYDNNLITPGEYQKITENTTSYKGFIEVLTKHGY